MDVTAENMNQLITLWTLEQGTMRVYPDLIF